MSDDSGATRKLNTAPSPAIYALEKITSMRSAFPVHVDCLRVA